MPRIRIRNFSGGLYLSHPRDEVPAGTLYRSKGTRNAALTRSLRSRWGSQQVQIFPFTRITSITTFHRQRFFGGWNGSGNYFGTNINAATLPSKGRLTYVSGIPTVGKGTLAEAGGSPEHLFLAGGDRALKARDGNQIETWGIAPPDPVFTTGHPIDFANGVNFKFWETFNSLSAGTTATMHPTAADQSTPDVTLSLETDPARLPPLPGSGTCLRVDIKDGHFAIVQRAFADATNAAPLSSMDFRTFAPFDGQAMAGPPSAEQDWIVLDVMCDHPEGIEAFSLNFGTGNPDAEYPCAVTHTRELLVDDPVVRNQPNTPFGVGDIAQVREDQAALVDPNKGPSSPFIKFTADAMAVDRLSGIAYEWRRLKIPKSSFTISPGLQNAQEPWAALTYWQIAIRTKELGTKSIPITDINVWIDNGSLFGGTGMQGEYKYLFTFKNTVTGSRSNPNKTPLVVKTPYRTGVQLSTLPLQSDPQVNALEIWRTEGNGSIYFLNQEIQAGLLTYFDQVSDFRGMAEYPLSAIRLQDADLLHVLGSEEIQFDNQRPPDTMGDVVGPHLGRLFGTRDTAHAAQGRVYYTPPGRLEAWPDFLTVSGDNDPMQKLVIYAGTIYAFSQTKVWEIVGEGPFVARELFGVPGTHWPFSVVATPYGIVYLARDGVRVLNGTASTLVAPEAVLPLFRGEQGEGFVTPFPATTEPQGVSAAFWNDEYFLTDGEPVIDEATIPGATLAVNLATGAWREVGLSFLSIYREEDTNKLLVGRHGDVLDWEVPGVVQDVVPLLGGASTPIPFHVQLPAFRPDAGLEEFIVQRLYIDIDTHGQPIPVTLFAHEDIEAFPRFAQPPFPVTTTRRQTVEISLCEPVGVSYVTFDANLVAEVEIFGVEVDVHVPGDPNGT